MWPSFILYLVFEMIFGALSPSTPHPNSKLHHNWKYVHKSRLRRLDYHLVIHCRRRVCQSPWQLDGTVFPPPCYITHRRRRRRNPKAKACHHHRVLSIGTVFSSPRYVTHWIRRRRNTKTKARHNCRLLSVDPHFRLNEPIPPNILDNLYVSRDFNRLPKLISNFQE